MKLRFWGSRGSLPSAVTASDVRKKVFRALQAARGLKLDTAEEIDQFIDRSLPFAVQGTYGCNTPCTEIINPGGDYLFFDAGTGIRDFATQYIRAGNAGKPATFHIFVTHLHWDHIQGFPFFVPIYIPGNRIIFHSYHETTPDVIREQMKPPVFPVDYSMLPSTIEFDIREYGDEFEIPGYSIRAIKQNHPGDSYGFRWEKDGRVLVYSSDSEHPQNAASDPEYPFHDFFRDADLLVFDAQYTLADATFAKANWGHSSNVMGVELSARAKVKHLCMFHNEPTTSDTGLDEFLYNTRMYADIYHSENQEEGAERYPRKISLAYDGMEVEV